MAYKKKKKINEVAAKRIIGLFTPLGQILTKGCDKLRIIHPGGGRGCSYPCRVSIKDGGDPQLIL